MDSIILFRPDFELVSEYIYMLLNSPKDHKKLNNPKN